MAAIKFKYNLNNKLNNVEFTTIRIDDPARYQVGQILEVVCGDINFQAIITKMQLYFNLEDIPIESIKSDGIKTRDEFINLMKEFYGDIDRTKWVMITLRKVE